MKWEKALFQGQFEVTPRRTLTAASKLQLRGDLQEGEVYDLTVEVLRHDKMRGDFGARWLSVFSVFVAFDFGAATMVPNSVNPLPLASSDVIPVESKALEVKALLVLHLEKDYVILTRCRRGLTVYWALTTGAGCSSGWTQRQVYNPPRAGTAGSTIWCITRRDKLWKQLWLAMWEVVSWP